MKPGPKNSVRKSRFRKNGPVLQAKDTRTRKDNDISMIKRETKSKDAKRS
jgi:hypothetical protein